MSFPCSLLKPRPHGLRIPTARTPPTAPPSFCRPLPLHHPRQHHPPPSMASPARDYASAIAHLNTLQSNHAVVSAIRASGRGMNTAAIPEMHDWLARAGLAPPALAPLHAIHIAGTKGKGSTSAFVSALLRAHARHAPGVPRPIGLYTSPHLRSVRERIQLDARPLSEAAFAAAFFTLWDRLGAAAVERGPAASGEVRPVYFRFLTLLAFQVFLSAGVECAVVECGIGGEYDSTNVLRGKSVCGVTALGVDHVAMLGGTVEEIAWHKGGIFAGDVAVRRGLTVAGQPGGSEAVLRRRAEEAGMTLGVVGVLPGIAAGTVPLGLQGAFQRGNASLAVVLAAEHLRARGAAGVPDLVADPGAALPAGFAEGLREVQWGGRCETRAEMGGRLAWHIDGGHTLESIRLAAAWFGGCLAGGRPARRVLFFNQQTRDAAALARALHQALGETVGAAVGEEAGRPLFDCAVFSTNITYAAHGESPGRYKPDLVSINTNSADVTALTVQNELAAVWREVDRGSEVVVKASIEEAVAEIRKLAEQGEDEVKVLVTGSLHLVGGVLEVLEGDSEV